MTNKIEPITLDEYVDIVKPEKGLIVYDSSGSHTSKAFNGNSQGSNWHTIGRNSSYLLSRIGIPNMVVRLDSQGEVKDQYQEAIEIEKENIIKREFIDKNGKIQFNPRRNKWYEDTLIGWCDITEEKVNSAKSKAFGNSKELRDFEYQAKREEDLLNSLSRDCALWVPDCFCCVNPEVVHKMQEKYTSKKLGVLVPRDHDYFCDSEKRPNKIFPQHQDDFLFVAPELSEHYSKTQ
ncbi:MAG: hypothetical protein U9Q06_02660 [Nanoarchaeota archaeon]|nr:hypothetical protein [Nanoarchaeota archaeon]